MLRAGVVSKYSDSVIMKGFYSSNYLLNVSNKYINDPVIVNQIQVNITKKLAIFRDACVDLSIPDNQKKVEEHFNYLMGSDALNCEFRGYQVDISCRIFRDLTKAAQVDFRKLDHILSASSLGNSQALNTNILSYVPRVEYPVDFDIANPDSFKNATEFAVVKVHSAITGNKNIMSGDQAITHQNNKLPIIVNHRNKNHDFDSVTSKAIIQNDVKIKSLAKVVSQGINGEVVSVGSISVSNELKYLASIALNSYNIYSKLSTVDPSKNTARDVAIILNKVKSSGEVKDAADLIGFSTIINSEFTKDPSSHD